MSHDQIFRNCDICRRFVCEIFDLGRRYFDVASSIINMIKYFEKISNIGMLLLRATEEFPCAISVTYLSDRKISHYCTLLLGMISQWYRDPVFCGDSYDNNLLKSITKPLSVIRYLRPCDTATNYRIRDIFCSQLSYLARGGGGGVGVTG